MTAGSARFGTMDLAKPFKTIEVIDSRTSQVCKVACMSCIRGHRTTSCGIPVCRPKIFWTVKRPGRPSNSCTCRYGATGGCKCVVARTACPHKSKKGEKRSGECRCDEQGRFCCLLEQEHWAALSALQRPIVDFFPSRDALSARQAAARTPRPARTPSLRTQTPHTDNGHNDATTVYQQDYKPALSPLSPSFGNFSPPQTTLTPRFGFLGIGAPQGLPEHSTPDVLTWQGEVPQAPREWPSSQDPRYTSLEQSSCCQNSTSLTTLSMQSGVLSPSNPFELSIHSPYTQETDGGLADSALIISGQLPKRAMSPFERFQMQFTQQQQASAICQSCGLSGCICRNCPPVFQNPNDTSWGQGCGRKHARETPLQHVSEPTNKVARLRPEHVAATGSAGGTLVTLLPTALGSHTDIDGRQNFTIKNAPIMNMHPIPAEKYTGFDDGVPPDLSVFGVESPLVMPGDHGGLDFSQYLTSDLDPSDRQRERGDSGGGGGCCCGGS